MSVGKNFEDYNDFRFDLILMFASEPAKFLLLRLHTLRLRKLRHRLGGCKLRCGNRAGNIQLRNLVVFCVRNRRNESASKHRFDFLVLREIPSAQEDADDKDDEEKRHCPEKRGLRIDVLPFTTCLF